MLGSIVCPQCHQILTQQTICSHIDEMHDGVDKIYCSICNTFVAEKNLSNHQLSKKHLNKQNLQEAERCALLK